MRRVLRVQVSASDQSGQPAIGFPEWLEWMELEIDNIRSVLRRCLDPGGQRTRDSTLASSLVWYWITRATS